MPVIKHYPNRKLYDTSARQYISLEGIAELVRQGEEVQVVDHATGEDLTTLTLTQIIVEQEKLQSGFLPLAVLTGLIRSGGNTLANLRRSLTAPLEILRQVDEEIEQRVRQLVSLGELAEGEAERLLEKLASGGTARGAACVEDALARELRGRTLPTRADLQALDALLDQLAAEVGALASARVRK